MEMMMFETGTGLFCIAVLFVIIATDAYMGDMRPSCRSLRRMYFVSLAFIVMSIICWETSIWSEVGFMSRESMVIMHFLIPIISTLWIVHVFDVMEISLSERPHLKAAFEYVPLSSIPAFILLQIAETMTGGKIMILGADLHSMIHIAFIIAPLYAAIAYMAYMMMTADMRIKRRECITAMTFMVPLLIASHVDEMIVSYSTIIICITLGLLIMFFNTQNQMIVNDPLTGIGNLSQIRTQFHTKSIEAEENGRSMYFAISDIDDFRGINEGYGDDEGDRVLYTVGRILSEACGLTDAFVGRHGGDEFVIIDVSDTDERIRGIMDRVEEISIRESGNHPYDIGISIGLIRVDADMTLEDCVEAADKVMVEVKAERKSRKKRGEA